MSADPEYMYIELVPTAHGGDLALLEKKLERLNEDEDPLLLYEGVVDLAEVKETLGELRPGRRATIVLGVDDDLQPAAMDPDEAEDAVKSVVRAIERFGGSKNRAFEVAVAYFEEEPEESEDPDDDDSESDPDDEDGDCDADLDEDEESDLDSDDDDSEFDSDDDSDDLDEDRDDLDDEDADPETEDDDEPDEEPAALCALIRVVRLARVAA